MDCKTELKVAYLILTNLPRWKSGLGSIILLYLNVTSLSMLIALFLLLRM